MYYHYGLWCMYHGGTLNPIGLPHAPPSNHDQFLSLPLPSLTPSTGPSSLDGSNCPLSLLSGVCHNLWGSSIDQQNSPLERSSNPHLVSVASVGDAFGRPHDVASQLGLRRSGVSPRQGLSLSLSSQQVSYRLSNVETIIHGQPEVPTISLVADETKKPGSSTLTVTAVPNWISRVQSIVLNYSRNARIWSKDTGSTITKCMRWSFHSSRRRTISKHFRCLEDAMSKQIKATSKSLGEVDCLGAKIEGSRLRYVDHQLRQQRVLQQLGMAQHNNALKPQRGLPERAVCVLRAWLFEHFLHQYPQDSDKHMLAKQTGLTRSQLSNWFINARVRLWKPMVEEMYNEEVQEQQERTNGSLEIINANKSDQQKESGSSSSVQTMDQVKAKSNSKPKSFHQNNNNNTSPTDPFPNSTISTSPMGGSHKPEKAEKILAEFSYRDPADGDERLFKDGYSCERVYGSMREIERFDGDQQQVAAGFNGNSGVSLTLGLPHCEKISLSRNLVSNHNINQVGRRLELGASESDIDGINT
ncbi:Homeobox protein BEL1-like protein [Hibiscus syriacus]|uniref:Homeobox protein BEL1-like protein n=1 Tax=Hibiscus syriacus TaxID=106335 RepID=A0A6A3CJ79_HIBSY|nr:Homeobox protein BEL1-like protein [Hibiscus syriacus]